MNKKTMIACTAGLLTVLVTPVTWAESTKYINARIHTMDPAAPIVEAMCVVDGRIAATCPGATEVDLGGQTVIPGFIEGHGHLMSAGFAQLNLDLTQVASYDELIEKVAAAADQAEPGEWIEGRGWHQSKWTPQPRKMVKGFQVHDRMSAVSPDNPVYLGHASGHAAFVNAKAMEIAGIDENTTFTGDGEIIRDEEGNATGVLNELAQNLVRKHVPKPSLSQRERALTLALESLAMHGVTSFQDAGSGDDTIELLRSFMDRGQLTARVWVMLAGSDKNLLERWFRRGPAINEGDDRLTVRAIKLVADGALGSRGAWLIKPYSDRRGHVGLPTMSLEDMRDISHLAYQHGFQIGTHAIGDRANREILDIYSDLFDGVDRGVRFRVEHAQHIDPEDIPMFGKLGVIASVQGIHMSSDRPWAIDRLGAKRIREGAYVWRKLLDTGAILANGTDVPVEPVSPFASFYSLVSRQTLKGTPPGGYEPSQKLTREEALRSYTIDAAYAAFEEDIKGSITPGKWADFVVLDRDIMDSSAVPDAAILDTQVLMTVVGGEVVYEAGP